MDPHLHRHCSCLDTNEDDWRGHGRNYDAEPDTEQPVRTIRLKEKSRPAPPLPKARRLAHKR